MKGIAFKVTYNDGGADGGLVGFRGVCSNRMIAENALNGGAVWCSQKENPCHIYAKHGFDESQRPKLKKGGLLCYESTLLSERPFRFGAGFFHNGPREGEAMPIVNAEVGDIAFLTTIAPDGRQDDRFIFACFRIGRLYEDDDWGNVIESDGTMDIIFPDEVARSLYFWNHQPPNKDGSHLWGSGLFRYLEPQVVKNLLGEALFRLGDATERDVVLRALGAEVKPVPPKLGGPGGGAGGTGEGPAHLELKHRVAKDPTLIGLPAASKVYIEHGFLTGDRVDLRFDLPDGSAAVVEIETLYTLIGVHQAVKYQALHRVQRGETHAAGRVEAILVAYQFDQETKSIATQHGIRLVVLPPPKG